VFSQIAAHSPRTDVIACADVARKTNADLLVAVGGGSVIDAVKVVQLALWGDVRAPEDLGKFLGNGAAALEPGVRMIALPTTLSAAEFTPFAGVTDTTRASKEGFFHKLLAPRVVILDPRLTLETPPRLWFSTGMKAVDHAVEILCHRDRAPFSDALAADGLQRLHRGLQATKADPGNLEARLECQFGMWLAISGIASGRGMGASHAIGHVLGGSFGVPHGLTSCVILPAVLSWNAPAIEAREAVIAALLERSGSSASEAVKSLVQNLGLPTHLAEIGIQPAQFRAIAEGTMHDRGVQTNPRRIDGPDDIVEILQRAV
jgi:maleylacetate reductase